MRLLFFYLCLVVFCATYSLRSPTTAQEAQLETGSSESAQSKSDSTSDSSPEEESKPSEERADGDDSKPWHQEGEPTSSGPDIYHLPDKNGDLRKVLGFRYEDFLKLWQQKDSARKVLPPKYLLESIRVTGNANDTHVEIHIELDILPRIDGWIEVPLDLPSLIIQEWEINDQTDEEFLVFNAKQDSYVLWLKSDSKEARTLSIQGLTKLKLAPGNAGIELKLPHAADSKFILQVPIPDARFEASPGVEVKTAAGEKGGTEAQLFGQASPLRLQWKSAEQQEQSGNSAIKAVGKLEVLIDQRRATYDTELKINSYGDSIERLRIRIPAGAILTGETLHEGFRVVKQTPDPTRGDIVEIELPESENQEWSLRLSAEQSRSMIEGAGKEDATYRLTGFEVIDAFRQSGTLLLQVDERLQAYFDLSGDIDQIPTAENSQSIQNGPRSSSFAYSRFPWALEVHTLDRQSRVSVKPKYEMHIEQVNDKFCDAKLDLQFDYQFAGANTFAVRVDMRGWELTDDAIQSNGISLEKIYEKPGGLLVLPLENPNSESLRLSMSVRRSVSLGLSAIPLPAAQEEFSTPGSLSVFVLPGELRVSTDASLQVTPEIVTTDGVRVANELADSQDSTLAEENGEEQNTLLLRTFRPRSVLSTEIRRREQQIGVNVQTHVNVTHQMARISQQLNYTVKYRPTSQLLLAIPESLWENSSLKVLLDNEELPFSIVREPAVDGFTSDTASTIKAESLLRISLPRPRQNDFQVDLLYQVPSPELVTGATSPLVLPLILPKDQVLDYSAEIIPEQSLRANLNQPADEGPWNAKNENGKSDNETLSTLLTSNSRPTNIPLLLQLESKDQIELPTLEKAWIQTWVLGERQQIRAAFRFRTSQQTIVVQLPTGLRNSNIEVLLDGTPSSFEEQNSRATVSVPVTNPQESHTLELRYQIDAELASWNILQVSLPRLECRPNIGHISWQLVLPRGWHVADAPSQLTPDYKIGWNNSRWGRHPTADQPQLEESTHAISAPKPSLSSNQYLYSGFEFPHEIRVILVSRLWLVTTCILVVFGIGMLLVTTSIAKHVSFWGLLALSMTAGAFSYPEFTFLAIQAIFWGGIMTISAILLQKTFASPAQPGYVLAPATKSVSTAVTESWIHGQPAMPFDEEAETTAIRTSRPIP